MHIDQLDYALPEGLIAQAPLSARDGARLLQMASDGVTHRRITDLAEILPPCLWVLNDTRVIPARLFGRRPTGGHVELLLVERQASDADSETWLCMVRCNKPLSIGATIDLGDGFSGEVRDVAADGMRQVRLQAPGGVERGIDAIGQVPLPPYIRRAPDADDVERYQTVFAKRPGAVAAPTAGLHLSESLLERLRTAGHAISHITLHVGPGTFAPLKADRLAEHRMHAERFEIPEATAEAIARAKRTGTPVLAVGTTVVRTLEAAAAAAGQVRAGCGRTDIFIYPPYRFSVVDRLLTNFHLPRSTLLALVMAFGGVEPVRAAYLQAVAARYRFFSYGDAMLLRRVEP